MRSFKRTRQPVHPRSGGIFQYYFAYLLMTSVILSSAGFCIHLTVKAFDDQYAATVATRTTLAVRKQFRLDELEATTLNVVDGRLKFEFAGDGQSSADVLAAEWRSDRNVLIRSVVRSGGTTENRFVFPLGSKISLKELDEHRAIVRVQDPSPLQVLERESLPESNGQTDVATKPPDIEGLAEVGSLEFIIRGGH
ncbi:MAG: hypothetical protein JNL58_07840 [Planctomyces sp.]|nr:hypothetical protein [Planctomyces sp.]